MKARIIDLGHAPEGSPAGRMGFSLAVLCCSGSGAPERTLFIYQTPANLAALCRAWGADLVLSADAEERSEPCLPFLV